MPETASSLLLRGYRVLVVEDEYFIAAEIAELLRREGAVVLGPAGTLGGAWLIVESAEGLDAALLDVNVQGEMIWPLLDSLQSRVPVVLTSGYDQSAIPARYREISRCEKPADADTVARALAAAIAAFDPAHAHRLEPGA